MAKQDVNLLGLIYNFVLTKLLRFFSKDNEHRSLCLLNIGFAANVDELWFVHEFSEKDPFFYREPIHLFLQPLLLDVRMDFERE